MAVVAATTMPWPTRWLASLSLSLRSVALDRGDTVNTFCREHHISRSYLYQLWNEGKGPQRTKIGRRTLISREAAAAWRRRMEAETERQELVAP